MAKWITLANGKWNEQYQTLYCESTTREYKGKKYNSQVYDSETKSATEVELEIVLRDRNSGQEIKIDKFQIKENPLKKEDWHPTHIVKAKISD